MTLPRIRNAPFGAGLPRLALVLAAAGLSACTAREAARAPAGPRYASLDTLLDRADSRPEPVRAATPMAVLPDWIGAPLRLREADRSEAFEQAVSLSLAPRSARENLVMVRLVRAEAGETGPGGRPTEAGIRAELAALFPDTPMQVVTRPAANAYGPYGLAIGRAPDGARCLYAWQWIAEAPALDPDQARPGQVSLRVRICRADVTAEALAAAVNQMRLVPRFAGTPIGQVRPAAALSTGPTRAEPARQERRRARSRPASQPAQHSAPEASPGPAGTGRRYLGSPQPASPAPPQPAGASVRGRVPGLLADLPPEALRGPAGRETGAR